MNDFIRYLAAKKSIDDRALNAHVWQAMAHTVQQTEAPLRVLEIGAGIGTMAERLQAHGLLEKMAYTAVDHNPDNIRTAAQRLSHLSVQLEAADLFEVTARAEWQQSWDLIIAHAFLDLVDIPTALPQIFSLLRPGGHFYFTLNFDAATILEPTIDPVFDQLLELLYHQTMDQRLVNGRSSGDSRSGRHLFAQLRTAGGHIKAAGSSDWVVFAGEDEYAGDEAFFLHFIVNTMADALADNPRLDKVRLAKWLAQRHAQIEAGELVYIAHQIDFWGKIK